MAAPRKYSQAQRQEMLRLYEAGKSPTEIASMCEKGTAGIKAFTIPRRTAQEIVKAMAAEAEQEVPATVHEAESAEAVERFPMRITRIVDAEIDRLNTKQKQRGLTCDDFDRLEKAASLSITLHKRLNARRPQSSAGKNGGRQRAGSQPAPETVIEKLARKEMERAGEEDQPSPVHTHQSEDDSSPTPAESPPAHSPRDVPPTSAKPPDAGDRTQILTRVQAAERKREAMRLRTNPG